MGWSIGFDEKWQRDIGYGVPAQCDHPGCLTEIHRGLEYVCGSEPRGGDNGCGLYFCGEHRFAIIYNYKALGVPCYACTRCFDLKEPFEPSVDIELWRDWKKTDASWAEWREENPDKVKEL